MLNPEATVEAAMTMLAMSGIRYCSARNLSDVGEGWG